MSNDKPLLNKGQPFNENYMVGLLLNTEEGHQRFRLHASNDECVDIKVFNTEYLLDYYLNEVGLLQSTNRDLTPLLIDHGRYGSNKLPYIVIESIPGEPLLRRLERQGVVSDKTAIHMVVEILELISKFHHLEKPLCVNDLSPSNILIDMSEKNEVYKLVDISNISCLGDKYPLTDLSVHSAYTAPELLTGDVSAQSDIYSAGVLFFKLLTGKSPWRDTKIDSDVTVNSIAQKRARKLTKYLYSSSLQQKYKDILFQALATNPNDRFNSINEFIDALNNNQSNRVAKKKVNAISDYSGFNKIAGMDYLKELMKRDVIDALNNRAEYEKYGLTIPNGMLLYGPPGCGKTFFAECLAEEVGFQFYQMNPSDLQSKWINESQERIKKLFDDARENSPSIIFIDELDAIVPSRNGSIHHMHTSTVNELLAQLNNCGDDEVFLIGATNKPETIDAAILRTGRLDRKVYVPVPDHQSRVELFKMGLKNRPLNDDINYDILARETNNFVASDIKFICDEAARVALKLKQSICQNHICESITEPSLSALQLAEYAEKY